MRLRHAMSTRGLMSTRTSPFFEATFGRMFRAPCATQFGANEKENLENLAALGKAMSAAPDEPKNGKNDKEGGVPALYTYLGQFIDHDLTFDPASSPQKENDPDALVDYRTPAFTSAVRVDRSARLRAAALPFVNDGAKARIEQEFVASTKRHKALALTEAGGWGMAQGRATVELWRARARAWTTKR